MSHGDCAFGVWGSTVPTTSFHARFPAVAVLSPTDRGLGLAQLSDVEYSRRSSDCFGEAATRLIVLDAHRRVRATEEALVGGGEDTSAITWLVKCAHLNAAPPRRSNSACKYPPFGDDSCRKSLRIDLRAGTSLRDRKSVETWSVLIAAYAAVVSTGLLVVRALEYRSSAAQIQVSTILRSSAGDLPTMLALTVTNRGRGAATIRVLDLDLPGPVVVPFHFGELIVDGPQLPARVEPHDLETWLVSTDDLKARIRYSGWPGRAGGIAALGTGRRVWESIHRYATVHQQYVAARCLTSIRTRSDIGYKHLVRSVAKQPVRGPLHGRSGRAQDAFH
jgi:hypothetical protein